MVGRDVQSAFVLVSSSEKCDIIYLVGDKAISGCKPQSIWSSIPVSAPWRLNASSGSDGGRSSSGVAGNSRVMKPWAGEFALSVSIL